MAAQNPVKPSDICDSVPTPTATICSRLTKFWAVINKICSFWSWAWDSQGNASEEFKSSFESVNFPVGGVVWYPVNKIPGGFLAANGQAVSRTTYAALFGVIGTSYGAGDGSTTFLVPNLTGKFLFGADGTHAVGSTGGSETVTLTTTEMPSHTHTTMLDKVILVGSGGGASAGSTFRNSANGEVVLNNTGGGQAHANMPPYAAGLWCIKF